MNNFSSRSSFHTSFKAFFHWVAYGSCDINIFTFTVYRHIRIGSIIISLVSLLLRSEYRIFHPFDIILEHVYITYLYGDIVNILSLLCTCILKREWMS